MVLMWVCFELFVPNHSFWYLVKVVLRNCGIFWAYLIIAIFLERWPGRYLNDSFWDLYLSTTCTKGET